MRSTTPVVKEAVATDLDRVNTAKPLPSRFQSPLSAASALLIHISPCPNPLKTDIYQEAEGSLTEATDWHQANLDSFSRIKTCDLGRLFNHFGTVARQK